MSKKSLDALGVAITNAGYTWTPEMRSAYEKGIRESEWVWLTYEEKSELVHKYKHIETGWLHDADLIAETEAKLKEKNT